MAFSPLRPDSYCPARILNGLCVLLQGDVGRCTVAVEYLISAAGGNLLKHRAQPTLDRNVMLTLSLAVCKK